METLLSVGIDLGTTTTQMVVSQLEIENTASAFAVPQLAIRGRRVCYRSPVHLTPLHSADTLDAVAIGAIIREEYKKARITPQQVQTGAVIITGETARKENAKQVLAQLADLAGDFVVATAGPALESVLAARGAGADRYAKEHGETVLHLDIGGGTTNLALFGPRGELLDTGCLNIGGRLMKFDPGGRVCYRSEVLRGIPGPQVGMTATPETLQPVLEPMIQALEEACGVAPMSGDLKRWVTDRLVKLPPKRPVFSFSGGVADLIEKEEVPWLQYGDLGVLLGRAIRRSRLCAHGYVLGRETLRATVIGAGSYATRLSGSTVYYDQVPFPLQNLPVERLREAEMTTPQTLAAAASRKAALHGGEPVALALDGHLGQSYEEIALLAEGISRGAKAWSGPVVVVLHQDRAKALGQALRARLGKDRAILCLDGLEIPEGSYLDVASPVGGGAAIPVVVKTLAF